jgi:iron complex transport system substrate-binding protein
MSHVFARRGIAALIGLMMLVACAQGAPAPVVQPSASPAPAGATSAAPADTTSPSPEATPEGSGETRTIEHAMGTTEVPVDPQRVVVLDTGELDSVLALGVTPVGAVEAIAGEGFQGYLEDQTANVEIVGTIAEPNLEAIVALDPDLIISNKVRHEAIYDQLSQIAPTVFAERVGVAWKENFDLHAKTLGKTAEAEQIKADYQARIEQLQQQLGQPEEISVSVVRFLEDQVRQYQKGSFIGTILEDIGVARPEQQRLTDETWTEVNRELIPQLDADVMFVTSYGPAEKTPKSEFQSDPLWSQLEVVQQDRVFEVSDDHWMLGLGYLAAERVLDDLEQYLVAGSAPPAATAATE